MSRPTKRPLRHAAAGDGEPPQSKKRRAECSTSESDPSEALASVDAAFASVDGYEIARTEKRRQRDAGVFIEGVQYGEVKSSAFACALGWCSPKPGETFIDLGSGTGKAVLTAAALSAFSAVEGVEILRPLHEAAVAARARCNDAALRTKLADVHFHCADALAYPWAAFDIVFVSLTCFTDEQVARVRERVADLATGARIIVTSRTLDSAALKMLRRADLPYGKGRMTFIAYERI